MIARSAKRQRLGEESILGFAVSLSIVLGVFLQLGGNIYTSNIIIKLFGMFLPISLAFSVLILKDKTFSFTFFRRSLIFLVLALVYISYLVADTDDFGRLFLGTADRNLGLASWGLAALSFIAGVALRSSQRHRVLLVLALTAAVQSLIVGYQKFFEADVMDSKGIYQPPPVYGTFYNPNPLSYFLGVISSGLLAHIFFSKWRARQIRVLGILLIFSLAGLYWSASSQGLIGLIVVAGLIVIQRVIPNLQRNFSALLIFVYTSSLSLFCLVVLRTPLTADSNVSLNPFLERLEIYKAALLLSSKNIWTGIGLDRFASEYGSYTVSNDLKLVDNAHSIPLQILSTQGVIGLVLLLSMTVWVFSFKPNESLCSIPEWSFWQFIFFSSSLIGIIGIGHPVLILVTSLAAGILRSMSLRKVLEKQQPHVLLSSKSFYPVVSVFSIGLVCLLFIFTQSELRVANQLIQLSERTLSASEFDLNVKSEYKDVYNARVLLTTGQAYIALENRLGAESVASLMLSRFPDDQRTSILFFAIADKWGDEEALAAAIRVRNQIFPNSK